MRKLVMNAPTFAAAVITRAMIGVGAGLLASTHVPERKRRIIGRALVGVGALSTIPIGVAVFRQRRKPRWRFFA